MALHIVLVEPEIPPNTGNIARTCAATGTVLHLVEPLGFSIEEKRVKRAGLDYWPYVDLRIHSSFADFLKETENMRYHLATTKGTKNYTEVKYKDEDMIIFGKETKGLDESFVHQFRERAIRIPMTDNTKTRSYNLSNSASIILFEALRQLGFPQMT